jgi:1,4-alpha-glucan branching enzyme
MDAVPYGDASASSARPMRSESLEAELAEWMERLKSLDGVLEAPVRSLIVAAKHYLSDPAQQLPSWISQHTLNEKEHRSLLVHALACSTLQRLWRTHRRYSWLSKDERDDLEKLQEIVAGSGMAVAAPLVNRTAGAENEDAVFSSLSDPVFGNLNPFVAAEVFWILLHAAENRVAGGAGFLSLFAMLWSLHGLQSPASGHAGDTRTLAASVAAKCLRPMIQFQAMFRTRARLYREIRTATIRLVELSTGSTPHSRWNFACAADWLSGLMLEMSKVATNRQRFLDAAETISAAAKNIDARITDAPPWQKIRNELLLTIIDLREENERTFEEASAVLNQLHDVVLPAIRKGDPRLNTHLRPHRPDETREQYQKRMVTSAVGALDACETGLWILDQAVLCCCELENELPPELQPQIAPKDQTQTKAFRQRRGRTKKQRKVTKEAVCPPKPVGDDVLQWTLARLANANERVADIIEQAIAAPVNWCRFVVRQEVAYASAGNDTEFDAAELLSGVSIAERSGHISELEVDDALAKALRAIRQDGSWTAGQPIFLRQRVLGVWPNTADIAWLLAGAVGGKPKLRRADHALVAFIAWLERTRTDFECHLNVRTDDEPRVRLVGWSSETRESKTIDFWITLAAINALLEIRELIEHRFWELCEKRFFVFRPLDLKRLDGIDPVDLGAKHEHRIHRRLRKSARDTSGPKYRDAEYSYVFHGPPGSSKTVMAEALGRELWRETNSEPRVIRVTPADFTRRGESGLDAEARFIFELLTHVRGVTIIFDEIDDLLRRRELKGVPAFLKMVVPAMLNRLQDLRDAAPRQEICFVVAMNYVDNVEPALIRPGRIDAAIPVVYPDPWSRDNTLDRVIAKAIIASAFTDRMRAHIVDMTAGWPWPLFNRLCEAIAGEQKQQQEQHAKDQGPNAPPFEASREVIDFQISDFGAQRQDAKSHYADSQRWKPVSPELVNEVAHFAFAFGREPDECTAAVGPIFPEGKKHAWVTAVVHTIKLRLASEWRREHRVTYDRDAASLTKDMGATRLHNDHDDRTIFRLWAPTARTAKVELEGMVELASLAQESDTVFSGQVPKVPAGAKYRYVLTFADGKPMTMVDPWGRGTDPDTEFTVLEQPPVRPADHRPMVGWQNLLIYQLHPATGSAAGNYGGLAERLDQIRELGFNTIDLVGPGEAYERGPVVYDPKGRRRRELAWGGAAGLRQVIDMAHAHNLSVIVGVTSHDLLGRPLFDLHSVPSYLHLEKDLRDTEAGPRPDFTQEAVLTLMQENVRRWFTEFHIDGLRWAHTNYVRQNVTQETVEGSSTPREKVRELAEGWNALRAVTAERAFPKTIHFFVAQDQQGYDRLVAADELGAGFNAQWSAGFERCIRHVLANEVNDFDALRKAVLRIYFNDPFRRIVFSESHDSVGQYGRLADYIAAKTNLSRTAARRRAFLATALALVTPGIPMVLQGQELSNEVPLDAAAPPPWDDEKEPMRKRLRDLISLRKNERGCTSGLQGHSVAVTVSNRVMVVDRWHEWHADGIFKGQPGNHTIGVFNFNDAETVHAVTFPRTGTWEVRFNSHASGSYGTDFGECPSGPFFHVSDSMTNNVTVGPNGVVLLSQNSMRSVSSP